MTQGIDYKKQSNEVWIDKLKLPSPGCNEAIAALRAILLRGLRGVFGKTGQIDPSNLEDFTQDSLLKILDKMDTFQGKSSFVTWCMKIAVNHTLTNLRRKQWKDISLDSLKSPENLISPGKLTRFYDGPEKRMMKREMVGMINNMINSELTEQQRRVMQAVMVHGVPLEEAAEKLNVTRNALYKTMHEARKSLKAILLQKNMDKDDILELFS